MWPIPSLQPLRRDIIWELGGLPLTSASPRNVRRAFRASPGADGAVPFRGKGADLVKVPILKQWVWSEP